MTDMTDNQQKFKELYINDIINGSGEMGEELLKLFDVVLAEFNDNSELMDTFIQSIIDENTEHVSSETEILQKQVAQMAFKLMQLEGGM